MGRKKDPAKAGPFLYDVDDLMDLSSLAHDGCAIYSTVCTIYVENMFLSLIKMPFSLKKCKKCTVKY